MLSTTVEAKVSVPGLHRWPGAAEVQPSVAYLAQPHRHQFVIRARRRVFHDDRDIEFIMLADAVRRHLEVKFSKGSDGSLDFGRYSCEGIASFLVAALDLCYCSVHEDDENGAIVEVTP